MKNLAVHPLTTERIDAFVETPSHALMLAGPAGSGKRALAIGVAEAVLSLPADSLPEHPYALLIAPEDGKAIGIEAVRGLERFLSLKVPGKAEYDRAVIIEDAHLMTIEAQNALLKMLEEPPAGSILILTINHEQSVLPTIRSRAQLINVGRLDRSDLETYFIKEGFDEQSVKRAYAVSSGLPGLMRALLSEESDHPLMLATERARQLLSQTAYERLAVVDELAKQRVLAMNIAVILQQMAHLSLQTATGQAAQKWQAVLSAGYEAAEALNANAQPKLALTKLMLSL